MLRVLLAAAAASAPHVVAHVPYGVAAFAQDAGQLAWVGEPRRFDARPSVGIMRANGSHRRTTTKLIARYEDSFGLAAGRVSWQVDERGLSDHFCVYVSERSFRSADLFTDGDDCGANATVVAANDGSIVALGPWKRDIWELVPKRRRVHAGDGAWALATAGPYVADLRTDGVGNAVTSNADISPDGSLIAASSERDASGGGTPELFILRRDGTVVMRLPGTTYAAEPRWSPDGTQLLWRYAGPVVARGDGTGRHILRAAKDVDYVDWCDSSTVGYVDVNGVVYTMPVAGGAPSRLVKLPGQPTGIDCLPDRTIAVSTKPGVWIVSGHKARRVVASSDIGWGVALSPDGGNVAYVLSDALHVVRSDGTGDRLLAAPDGLVTDDSEPRWAADGAAVSFTRTVMQKGTGTDGAPYWYPEGTDIWQVPVPGASAVRLTTTVASTVHRRAQLFSLKTRRLVSTLSQPQGATELALSPTSAAILAGSTLATYDIPSGRPLRDVALPAGAHSISVAGTRVVFSVEREIYAVDTRSGDARVVARATTDPIGLSIVGNRIAWAENRGRDGVILTLLLR